MKKTFLGILSLTPLLGTLALTVDIAKHEGANEADMPGDYEDLIGLPTENKHEDKPLTEKEKLARQREHQKMKEAVQEGRAWADRHNEKRVLSDQELADGLAAVKGKWAKAAMRAEEHLKLMKRAHKLAILQGKQGGMGFTGYIEVPTAESMPKHKHLQHLLRKKASQETQADKQARHELEAESKGQVLRMNDAGQGFHGPGNTSTQFPSLLGLAATFDTGAVKKYASALAQEFVDKGANVLLGPAIDIARVPQSGRAFETLSGEDPFLGSKLVQPYIQTVEDRGIITVLKHFLNNNNEENRHSTDVQVSDKAQYELYLPAFKAAIDAGAGGVMCSYNKVDGQHACESKKLLKDFLRRDLGFKGFVVSDWGAVYDAKRSVHNGLDIEMKGNVNPERKFDELESLLKSGQIREEEIDDMVRHILTPMYAAGQFDGKFPDHYGRGYDVRRDHAKVAKQTVVDGAVLLKNDGATLPLKNGKMQTVALVGKHCDMVNDEDFERRHSNGVMMGGGSGWVRTEKTVTPFRGLRDAMVGSMVKHSVDASAAAGADVAVVCAAAHAGEGWDRPDLKLDHAHELIVQARDQGARKVVLLGIAPGPISTEWIDHVDAALLVFAPGEQVGTAVADIITGAASPGGRLPVSLPKEAESRFTQQQFPGTRAGEDYDLFRMYNKVKREEAKVSKSHKKWEDVHQKATPVSQIYSEDTLVGYRWNDAKGYPAAFPFGFGLTYTQFEFSNIQVEQKGARAAKVSVTVKNVGSKEGAAVPQLYVSFPSLAPVKKQLRGFEKVVVPPQGVKVVSFDLDSKDWSYYNQDAKKWIDALLKGDTITISVGDSSTNLLLEAKLQAENKLVRESALIEEAAAAQAERRTWLSAKKEKEDHMFKQSLQALYAPQEMKLKKADKKRSKSMMKSWA